MRITDPTEVIAAFDSLRRERYSRVFGPEPVQDDRSTIERYYDSLPRVRRARQQEEYERQTRLPRSAAEALRDALIGVDHRTDDPGTIDRKRQSHIPLNGAGVLRAALAGGSGTINGASAATVESAARLIRREFSGRMGYAG